MRVQNEGVRLVHETEIFWQFLSGFSRMDYFSHFSWNSKVLISVAIEPLIGKKIFNTEEEAIREREYILRQIAALKRKYGMRFQQFSDYLHERSVLLENDALSIEQRQTIMQEEDKLEREETKETEVEKQLT